MKDVDLNKIKADKSLSDLLKFGIINIDKPSGPTSFSVSNYIRKSLGLNKTSHFGTLE
jgi:tRNA U55 pseudouridine synthase TruB